MTAATITVPSSQDATAIGNLAEISELFPAEALPSMLDPYLAGDSESEWLIARDGDGLSGFLYAEPEFLTVGTFNLRAMATRENQRGTGIGSALIAKLEETLRARGGRILLVETSSAEAFAPTRSFYTNRGFREEARIASFWNEGDDKVIYWKAVG